MKINIEEYYEDLIEQGYNERNARKMCYEALASLEEEQ